MYDDKPAIYNVNSFHQIGMVNPFPKEDLGECPKIPETFTDNVYPEERMCRADASPMCIYIPNRIMLFKIIRACIDAKTPEELWFNHNDEPEEETKKKKGKKHNC